MKYLSKALLVSNILAIAYLIYLIISYKNINLENDNNAAFYAILLVLVTPHIYLTALGVFLGSLSVILKNHQLALVASFIYLIAAIAFLIYAIFLLPTIILGFIGSRNQKKLNTNIVV
jgi:hypothetical protein